MDINDLTAFQTKHNFQVCIFEYERLSKVDKHICIIDVTSTQKMAPKAKHLKIMHIADIKCITFVTLNASHW